MLDQLQAPSQSTPSTLRGYSRRSSSVLGRTTSEHRPTQSLSSGCERLSRTDKLSQFPSSGATLTPGAPCRRSSTTLHAAGTVFRWPRTGASEPGVLLVAGGSVQRTGFMWGSVLQPEGATAAKHETLVRDRVNDLEGVGVQP